jgi:hypothetical protein
MTSVDTFIHVENIKRYRALLERETDPRQRSTLQSLIESEEAVLKTHESAARAIAPRRPEHN